MISKTISVITLAAAMGLSSAQSCTNFAAEIVYSDSSCEIPIYVKVISGASGWTESSCSYSSSTEAGGEGYTKTICSTSNDALSVAEEVFVPSVPFIWINWFTGLDCNTPHDLGGTGERNGSCIPFTDSHWIQSIATSDGSINRAVYSDSICFTKLWDTANVDTSGGCDNGGGGNSGTYSYETGAATPMPTTATPTPTPTTNSATTGATNEGGRIRYPMLAIVLIACFCFLQ